MTEAMNNLHLVQQAHKTELAQVHEEVHQQSKNILVLGIVRFLIAVSKEIDLLNVTLQEKNVEIKQLQKQLSDIERDKHTEIVKIRLEVLLIVQTTSNYWFLSSTCSMMPSFSKYKNKLVKYRVHLHQSVMTYSEE